MMRGVVPCGECGDHVNMGHFVISNRHNEQRIDVPYLALHALVEHKDLHYVSRAPDEDDLEGEDDVDVEGSVDRGSLDADAGAAAIASPAEPAPTIDDRLDIERLRAVLGQSRAHATFGARLAATLRGLQGDAAEAPAHHLDVIERPLGRTEACTVCGEAIDAGAFELRNVHTGHEMQLPYVAMHSLAAHGDAYYRGEHQRGWVDVPLLGRLVKRTWPVVQRVRR
ncbi:MAG: hypothetical protein R3B09_24930 [Nannocystaceae bacterium]